MWPARHAEWYFRSSLDRYVWIHGMLCAYLKPWAEGFLQRIDALNVRAPLLRAQPARRGWACSPSAPHSASSPLESVSPARGLRGML